MYNGRGHMSFLSPPHHLKKTIAVSFTIHHLLLSSLAIHKNELIFSKKLPLLRETYGTMKKIVFCYFLRDHPFTKEMHSCDNNMHPSLFNFSPFFN
jgi:hypothetical protein